MELALTGIDSIVMFQNSQAVKGRGTLVHITRRVLVFEVYNPFSIVQVSEVLSDVKVVRGEQVIYNGKAVVSGIVTTGLMVIVSATLVDSWADLTGLKPGKALQSETKRFIKDWETSHDIEPSYQLVVSTLRSFLEELSKWLEGAEVGVFDSTEAASVPSLKEEFYEEVVNPVAPKIVDLFGEFEQQASSISPEQLVAHKAFARREIHPLTMCSPFVLRTYTKPLGYAGDYEMVNMMLYESSEVPANTYAKIVDAFHIQTAAPEAHRNRIAMLRERLKEETSRVMNEGRPTSILNVGCGPAVEVQGFIREEEVSKHATFSLMDFSHETLEYAKRKIKGAVEESSNKTMVKFVKKSIDELLKESHEKSDSKPFAYDIVYSAGLFDYFPDHICKQLVKLFYSWVRPGGLLTVTNVHPNNPNRYSMEHLLEWHLIYRDEKGMKDLIPPGCRQSEISLDDTGINVFLDLRKEE